MSVPLAKTVPETNAESLRVYCSAHNLGFTAPRAARIKCESGGHELDCGFPYTELWEYCCDCKHYWRLDAGKETAEIECPACDRKISRRFLCTDCKVIAVESNTPGPRKAYSISSQGSVEPTCSGCLARPSTAGLEHECPEFGDTFVTARAVCPFCDDAIEPPPSFPCSVSSYLAKVRQTLIKLEFDPASNVLRESNSGDYVLIEKFRGSTVPIVIPAAPKLSSKQDYYNTYYELFNCDNPAAGEVVVLSPAIVEKAENGWQLREAGFIDIKPDPNLQTIVSGSQVAIHCAACGKAAAAEHAYCKHCGAPVLRQQSAVAISPGPDGEGEQQFNQLSGTQADQLTEELSRPSVGLSSSGKTVAIAGTPWKALLGGSAAMLIVIVIVISVALSGSGILPGSELSVEKKLDRAIAGGNLFSPSNENAYDLYYQLKNRGVSDTTLSSYHERLLPLLINRPLQMISNLMKPGSEDPPVSEWQAVIRPLQWAAELKPGDSVLSSRAIYCEGRVAYLLKQEDEALAAWKRAADADRSWPLPANGMGLIYFSRKNYGTARAYYLEAVQRDPNWAYPYNNLGTAFHYDKNDSSAKAYYRKAIELAPNWARPHAWLGEIAMREGEFGTAVVEYEAVLDPKATGTTNMDLDKIRSKLEEARRRSLL